MSPRPSAACLVIMCVHLSNKYFGTVNLKLKTILLEKNLDKNILGLH
jgi:hypothetical protein